MLIVSSGYYQFCYYSDMDTGLSHVLYNRSLFALRKRGRGLEFRLQEYALSKRQFRIGSWGAWRAFETDDVTTLLMYHYCVGKGVHSYNVYITV